MKSDVKTDDYGRMLLDLCISCGQIYPKAILGVIWPLFSP